MTLGAALTLSSFALTISAKSSSNTVSALLYRVAIEVQQPEFDSPRWFDAIAASKQVDFEQMFLAS
jgi:hypothetical protein